MRQVRFTRFGGPDVLEVVEAPKPSPGRGRVLVRIHAAGVNFADTLMRQNRYAVTPNLPAILGTEAAGIIESLGDGVDSRVVGARGAVPLFASGAVGGGYSDYLVIDAGLAVPMPNALSFEAATALMIQGLTALYLPKQVSPHIKIVLINVAAGGVGPLLIQTAKRAGAKTVIAAASLAQNLLSRVRSGPTLAPTTRNRIGWRTYAPQAAARARTSSTSPPAAMSRRAVSSLWRPSANSLSMARSTSCRLSRRA